jgi:hypothetical protein
MSRACKTKRGKIKNVKRALAQDPADQRRADALERLIRCREDDLLESCLSNDVSGFDAFEDEQAARLLRLHEEES